MVQGVFDFGFAATIRDDKFIVSDSNKNSLAAIESWPNWETNALFLYGPKESGKTMLANIWQDLSEAIFLNPKEIYEMVSKEMPSLGNSYIIEDIENIHDEAAFLHFFNGVKEAKGYLLLTASGHPANLKIRLADLRSRINAMICCSVSNPDDELLRTLFFKSFVERQLKVEMNVIDYLVSRTERSFAAVRKIVGKLDASALQEKRNITIPFVKETLTQLGYGNE